MNPKRPIPGDGASLSDRPAVKYRGRRTESGVEVVAEDDQGRTRPLPHRFDIRKHSPTGFEWGFSGSGPAQLALAVMADVLGAEKARECYQEFNDVGLFDDRDDDAGRAVHARVPPLLLPPLLDAGHLVEENRPVRGGPDRDEPEVGHDRLGRRPEPPKDADGLLALPLGGKAPGRVQVVVLYRLLDLLQGDAVHGERGRVHEHFVEGRASRSWRSRISSSRRRSSYFLFPIRAISTGSRPRGVSLRRFPAVSSRGVLPDAFVSESDGAFSASSVNYSDWPVFCLYRSPTFKLGRRADFRRPYKLSATRWAASADAQR